MGSTRRSFTPECKAQSVAFVIDGGRPVAEVAPNIGSRAEFDPEPTNEISEQ
jgi:transposase-like protein